MIKTSSPRLRRSAASVYLLERWGISRAPGTLAKLAVSDGRGPRFQKDGRVPLYPLDELDKWAASILGPLQASTSDKVGSVDDGGGNDPEIGEPSL